MPDRDTDHVLSAIDHAVSGWEVSGDAMRHIPEPAAQAADPARAREEAVRALRAALDEPDTTRAGLVEAGHLVPAPEAMAAEAGWRIPVAVTRAVWLDMVEWPDAEPAHQDETGRWWDVLFMAALAARAGRDRGRVRVELCRVPRGGVEAEEVELTLIVGPGDEGEPVITLTLPHE
jgi:hypothetical protein